jgi:hypothetical protein
MTTARHPSRASFAIRELALPLVRDVTGPRATTR